MSLETFLGLEQKHLYSRAPTFDEYADQGGQVPIKVLLENDWILSCDYCGRLSDGDFEPDCEPVDLPPPLESTVVEPFYFCCPECAQNFAAERQTSNNPDMKTTASRVTLNFGDMEFTIGYASSHCGEGFFWSCAYGGKYRLESLAAARQSAAQFAKAELTKQLEALQIQQEALKQAITATDQELDGQS